MILYFLFQGQIELVETINIWKQKGHIMTFFDKKAESKPTDFLSKFYDGHN